MFSSKRTGGGALQKVFTQRRIVCQARGTIERFDRFIVPVQQAKQMAARRPIGLIIRRLLRGNAVKSSQSDSRLACLRNRNGSPNKRTNPGRDSHQALVEQSDFLPIDVPGFRSISVNRLNGSFQLIASHALEGGSRVQMCLGFVNHRLRPKSWVLPILW